VRRAVKASVGLMENDGEDVQVFAVDALIKLAEMEIALMEVLREAEQRDERNPLARRTRIEP